MSTVTAPRLQTHTAAPPLPPRPEVRNAVKDLLLKSEAFRRLPLAKQQQIAHDTAMVADHLVVPGGIPGNQLPNASTIARGQNLAGGLTDDNPEANYQQNLNQVNKVGTGFKAVAAREGALVAGALLKQVNFPDFVSGLIEGVFHAIVKSSIEQMEGYAKLVSSVAQSLNDFRDENVSDNQGRDHLVDQFPDLFQINTASASDGFGGGGGGPRVGLKDGVDEDHALHQVNNRMPMDGGPMQSMDLEDPDNENKLVQASRTQLATSRQQLLATMVLMGINRIVVTDGKIQAKILYDFQARDNTKRQRSAAAFDYARDKNTGAVQKTYGYEGDYDNKTEGGETQGKEGSDEYDKRDASYYTKGTYKYSEQPVMTAMSAATESSESSLQTKASLAGVVDVNFKSDYFPLEKMADSFQIGQIQNASKPGRGAAAAAGAAPAPGAAAPASSTTTPATTAPAATTTTPQK